MQDAGRHAAHDLTPHERTVLDLMEETGLSGYQLGRKLGMRLETTAHVAMGKIRARKQLDCVLDKSGITSLSKARGNVRMDGTK